MPTDPNHSSAKAIFASTPAQLLLTTDYVLCETLTLFKMRGETTRAFALGRQIIEERICRLIWIEKQDVQKAWITFDTYRDKGWSFTDCLSRTVIDRLQISEAFAFDRHFHEFGNVAIVP